MSNKPKYFFYTIETKHVVLINGVYKPIIGFGITDTPNNRVRQYSTSSGVKQEFNILLFSHQCLSNVLEDEVKRRNRSQTHKLRNVRVEWFDPALNITIHDLNDQVKHIVNQLSLDCKILKPEYLPFDDSEWHNPIKIKNLKRTPELYLDNF
jgi:hypothetical protein